MSKSTNCQKNRPATPSWAHQTVPERMEDHPALRIRTREVWKRRKRNEIPSSNRSILMAAATKMNQKNLLRTTALLRIMSTKTKAKTLPMILTAIMPLEAEAKTMKRINPWSSIMSLAFRRSRKTCISKELMRISSQMIKLMHLKKDKSWWWLNRTHLKRSRFH